LSYELQVRRAAELDIAEAQVWYESRQSGLGGQFRSEVSLVIVWPKPLSSIKLLIATFAALSFVVFPI